MSSRPGTPRGHGSPSPLSIRRFSSTEEYMSVIRTGLSDWLNSLYNLNLTPDDLIEYLSTGVLLCHHANTWEVERGTDYRVHFSPRATHGSFQARDNVSLFINWCRRSLQFPETLLFETNDLVEGRNEHNFLVCLLEVARKGSEVGLPEPEFDLPDMCVETFATGPLSSIPLSYSDKKVPPAESRRDSGPTRRTPPAHRRHPQRTVSSQSQLSSKGATGNDVSSDKVTGNNVMMVVRDSHGKHTVLRDRTEPVNLQAKNYQLVCADTVELPTTKKDKRDQDAKLHVMAAIPADDMEAVKPGDEVFSKSSKGFVEQPKSCPVHGRSSSFDDVAYAQRAHTPAEKTRKPRDDVFSKSSTEFVEQQKSCPAHGRSSSLDDVGHGQRPNTPAEKTRTTRRWSDGFQTQRITGRRDSGKSPSERVLSRVIASKSSQGTHFESPLLQSSDAREGERHQHVSSPRRGSLGCSVCPNHSNEQESLESFWERLSRPKTRRKSLPSGLPTVSENVTRPRPKSADGRLHTRRDSFPNISSKDQISSPRGNTWGAKNWYSSTDTSPSQRPRPRPRSAMGKLGGPISPAQNVREKERPLSGKNAKEKTPDNPYVIRRGTSEETNRTGIFPSINSKDRTSVSPRRYTGMARNSTDKNGTERPRPRPRSAMGKLEAPVSPPQNVLEKERPLTGPNAKERTQDDPSVAADIRKSDERNRNISGKERTSISPRGNIARDKKASPDRNGPESPRPRPRSAMAILEAPIYPPQNPHEKGRNSTGRNAKEKAQGTHSLDIRKNDLDERNGTSSFPNRSSKERTSISPKRNTENFHPFPNRNNHESEPRPVAKLEGSSRRQVREKEQVFTGRDVKESKTPERHSFASDIRKKTSVERNGNSKASGRIPLERANSFTIKERRAQSESSNRTANHHREPFLSGDKSKSLPLIDEVFVTKRQERPAFGASTSTRPTGVINSASESAKQNNTFYPSSEHTSHNQTGSQRRRVSDSYAIGRHRNEVDLDVYEDFLKEVKRTKSPSPAVSRRLSSSTVDRQTTTTKPYNSDGRMQQHSNTTNSETNFEQNDETEETYSSFSGDTSPDLRRSSLRPCTSVPSDHKLPRAVSPRQDPVPWPPSKIPRPTFYAATDESGGPVSPSVCSNAKNLQEFLDYLHTSNALQRSESVSSTSDSSEGSTLI
ncbi:uncharacterized protein [Branchiostoma lanceolatum]|uniref:uncharacterized protein n=1 Tax=Branchiostoma lanceolatum TaxID=7740 RepID=UPI0034540DC0